MKNKKKQQVKKPVRQRRSKVVTVVVAGVVVLAAAITVISRQVARTNSAKAAARQPSNTAASRKFVTVKVAGRDVQIDPQTGQMKPLSAQEAQQIAEGLKTMLNKSTDGLVEVKHPDGTESIDLQGRYQNVSMARIGEDGTVETECTDEPGQAARFFGIDPKLVGVEPKGETKQFVTRTPVKKVSQ